MVKQKDSRETLVEFKGFLSFFILHELSKKNLCGDDLALKIGKRKKDKLTPGTIYPTLKKLRRLKLVKYKKKGRKKVYHLTEKGEKELKKLYKVLKQYFKGIKTKI
jgi:DNA-binding PadR family transcriptional regulator